MNRNSFLVAAFVCMIASFQVLATPALALSVPAGPAEVCEPPTTVPGIAAERDWDMGTYTCLSAEEMVFAQRCTARGGRIDRIDVNFDEALWGYCEITLTCCFPALPTYIDHGNDHVFTGKHK